MKDETKEVIEAIISLIFFIIGLSFFAFGIIFGFIFNHFIIGWNFIEHIIDKSYSIKRR